MIVETVQGQDFSIGVPTIRHILKLPVHLSIQIPTQEILLMAAFDALTFSVMIAA